MSDDPEDIERHFPDEATPAEAPEAEIPVPEFGLHDSTWTEEQWLELLEMFVRTGIGSWKDITALVLGHLNPSQVGTSLASSEGFKRKYGKGNTMQIVIAWLYQQTGRCADCGSRLELQADHIKEREAYADPLDADFIENMILRCRRCNVVRRPSHEYGGITFLTAEAALMWIMLVIRPRTLDDFIRMCRIYGMTMSDIRIEEAWAMAHWLARAEPPAFGIEDDAASFYDLVLWPDNAITRADVSDSAPEGTTKLYSNVSGSTVLGFVTRLADGRLKIHEQGVSFIPFSTYDLGRRDPQSLCIHYSPPDRDKGRRQKISPLPPRSATLVCHAIRRPEQAFQLVSGDGTETLAIKANPSHLGRLVKMGKRMQAKMTEPGVRLVAIPSSASR